MASLSHLGEFASTSNALSYTSGSMTPAAGDLLVVGVHVNQCVDDTATLTDSDGGTYTLVRNEPMQGDSHQLYVFVADQLADGSALTFTATVPTDAGGGCLIAVEAVADAADVGSAALAQAAVGNHGAGGTTPGVTFGSAPSTDNVVVAWAAVVGAATNPPGLTPPSGLSELVETGTSSPTCGIESCGASSGYTTAATTWGNSLASGWGAIAVEIAASAGASPQTLDAGLVDETAVVQGADLSASGAVTVDGGVVAELAVVQGADLAASGSAPLDAGLVSASITVFGADISTGAPPAQSIDAGLVDASAQVAGADLAASGSVSLDAGLVDVAASVLGADLAAAGAAALEAGLVQLATEVLGADLSPSGSVSIDAGHVSALVTVNGADIALLVVPPPRVYGVAEFPVAAQVVEFSSAQALSEYVASLGVPVAEYDVLVRLAGYDSPIVVVEYP